MGVYKIDERGGFSAEGIYFLGMTKNDKSRTILRVRLLAARTMGAIFLQVLHTFWIRSRTHGCRWDCLSNAEARLQLNQAILSNENGCFNREELNPIESRP